MKKIKLLIIFSVFTATISNLYGDSNYGGIFAGGTADISHSGIYPTLGLIYERRLYE
jgi:hypothetical protein